MRVRAPPTAAERADALREQVHVNFAALAVVPALRPESDHTSVAVAARTLGLTVLGTAMAVFIAEVIAHLTVHQALPSRRQTGHLLAVSAGALIVVVVPMLLLGGTALGLLSLSVALDVSSTVLVLSLLAVGWLAASRLRLTRGRRLLVLLGEAALGLAVVGVELAVH